MRKMETIPFVNYLDLFNNRRKAESKQVEVEVIKLMPKVEARTVKEFNVLIHLLFRVIIVAGAQLAVHHGSSHDQVRFNPALVQSIGLELLGKMRKMGHSPDAITYTTLINLLRKDPDPTKAWNVFRTMREQNVNPTQVTYGVMTHICALKRYGNVHSKTRHELLIPFHLQEDGRRRKARRTYAGRRRDAKRCHYEQSGRDLPLGWQGEASLGDDKIYE